MADIFSKENRSRIMSLIRGKNTTIEKAFRKGIYGMGFRGYRLNARVPGRPDVYFPRLKFAVFIDGCFWHKCPKCFRAPKSNLGYWEKKIADNVSRDRRTDAKLRRLGISRLHIWEHDVKKRLPVVLERFAKRYSRLGSVAKIG